jgi:hypothetical protein
MTKNKISRKKPHLKRFWLTNLKSKSKNCKKRKNLVKILNLPLFEWLALNSNLINSYNFRPDLIEEGSKLNKNHTLNVNCDVFELVLISFK